MEIFLCMCKEHEGCHRTELANNFNDQLGWEVQHLPRQEKIPKMGSLFAE
jgi:hypothetical protein